MIWKRKTKITEKKTATKKTYVKNAKKVLYDSIKFKSKLEVEVYKRIKEYGITPQYEGHKYILINGFYPTKHFFTKDKSNNLIEDVDKKGKPKKVLDITYTPDFQFYYHNKLIIIEAKGFQTDKYLIKKKMFRRLIEDMGDVYFFEIYNLKQLDKAMEIIGTL